MYWCPPVAGTNSRTGAVWPTWAAAATAPSTGAIRSACCCSPAPDAPPAQLDPADQVLRGRRLGLRREPVRVLGRRPPVRAPLPGIGDGRLRGRGVQQLLVEPPLDLRRARGARGIPGGALLHRQHRGVLLRPGRPRSAREPGGSPEA